MWIVAFCIFFADGRPGMHTKVGGYTAMTQHRRPEALQQLKSGFVGWEKLYEKCWRRQAIRKDIEEYFWLLFMLACMGAAGCWLAWTALSWLDAFCLSR